MKRMRYIFALIILLILLSACTEVENQIIETRVNGNSVEWKYESEDSWNHLLNLEDINPENQSDFDYWINDRGNLEIQMNDGIFEFPSIDNLDLSFIKSIYIDDQYNLIYEYQDGKTESIDFSFTIDDDESSFSFSINEIGELIISYDNGVIENLGLIKGDAGQIGQTGPQGSTGSQGSKGEIGEQGLSVYEIYQNIHPNYIKSEAQWLDDFIQGKLSLSDEFDIFNITDFDLGISLGFHKFRLQDHLVIPDGFTFLNHLELNLNNYSIEGDIIVDANDIGEFNIYNGLINGNVILTNVNTFRLDLEVEGNVEAYGVDMTGEIIGNLNGYLSIYGNLDLKVENNQSLLINSYTNGVVTLDGTIDQFHGYQNQLLIMEPFSLISHIEIFSNTQLEITRNQTSVIGSINPINQAFFTGEDVSTEDPSMIYPKGYIIGLNHNLEFEISLGRYQEITAVLIEGQSIDVSYYTFTNGILSIDSTYLDSLELEVMSIDIVLDADYPLQSIIPMYQMIPDINSIMNGYEGVSVSVDGVITKILNHKLMFIEDEVSVIAVYGQIDGLVVGDHVQVNGLKNIYNGLHQITNASIYHLYSQSNELSISTDYQYQMTFTPGMRINFTNVMISDLHEDFYGNIVFYIYDDINDIYYQALCDARLENFELIKEVLSTLDGQIISLNNTILSYNQQFIFYLTSLDEIFI